MANEVTIRLGVAGLSDIQAGMAQMRSSISGGVNAIDADFKRARGSVANFATQVSALNDNLQSLGSISPSITQSLNSIASRAGLAANAMSLMATAGGLLQSLRLASWFSAVALGVEALVNSLELYNAQKLEASSAKNLIDTNRQVADSFMRIIEAREKAGQLSSDRAAALRAMIPTDGTRFLGDPFTEMNRANPGLMAQMLSRMGGELNKDNAPALTQKAIDAQRDLAMAKAQAAFEVRRAELSAEEEAVAQSYARQEITLDGFLARRRQIVTQTYEAEASALEKREFAARAQLSVASDPAVKAKLLTDIEAINTQRKLAGIQLERELTKITADGESERSRVRREAQRIQLEQMTRELRVREDLLSLERSRSNADFRLTDVQRREEDIRLLREQVSAINDQVAALERLRATIPAGDSASIGAVDSEIARARNMGRGAGNDLASRLAEGDPRSFSDQWVSAFRDIRNEWGTTAQNIAQVGKTAMQGLTRTVGNVLDDMIWRSNSLADIWKSFAHLLTSTVTQAISQMFMQWIAGIVAKKGATIAAESAEATAKAPTALMESIKSYGIAAAVGVAALVAAMAAFGGFREQGGPVEAGSAYIVGERRPELFIPSTAGVILPSVNGAAPSSSGAGMSGGDDRPMRVVVVSDRRLAADLAKDSAYRTQIVDIMRQEQWRFRG